MNPLGTSLKTPIVDHLGGQLRDQLAASTRSVGDQLRGQLWGQLAASTSSVGDKLAASLPAALERS